MRGGKGQRGGRGFISGAGAARVGAIEAEGERKRGQLKAKKTLFRAN